MRIIVSGAGQVGYGIAEKLSLEGIEVTVIDSDADLVQRVRDNLDARGVHGHGSHPDVLAQAGARDADMLIAVTQVDEINMTACQVAHSIFEVPTRVARIRAQSYLNPEWSNLFSREHLPIDVIISPEVEVGDLILERLSLSRRLRNREFRRWPGRGPDHRRARGLRGHRYAAAAPYRPFPQPQRHGDGRPAQRTGDDPARLGEHGGGRPGDRCRRSRSGLARARPVRA